MTAAQSNRTYFSQFGEDRRLAKIFAGERAGACVEVGANNGVDGSTTLFFERLGWECVLVEPNPELCNQVRACRQAKLFECAVSSKSGVATLQVAVGAKLAHHVSTLGDRQAASQIKERWGYETVAVDVATRTLDDILAEACLAAPICFMSIDVEGHELDVLAGFTVERWKPRVLIVEDNGALWIGDVSRHLNARGYVRFLRTGVNDWYAERTDERLATFGRRFGYWPSMVVGRCLIAALRLVDHLRRLPGGRALWSYLKKEE